MTEQTNADRAHDIGMDAIDWDMVRDGVGDPEEAASIAVRAALEVADQRAAEYAAVVEKLREWVEDPASRIDIHVWPTNLSRFLAMAPADALREVKAEVWDEGEEAGMKNQANWDGWRDTKPPITNPYRGERA